jgi:hypothetical protein
MPRTRMPPPDPVGSVPGSHRGWNGFDDAASPHAERLGLGFDSRQLHQGGGMSDNPVTEPDYDLDDTQPIVGLPLDQPWPKEAVDVLRRKIDEGALPTRKLTPLCEDCGC